MYPSKKAFTLIELLVVIAIIAILAAILFPVFASAKMSAKMTATLSNSKQIILATIQYASANDDYTPTRDDSNNYYDWPRFNGWSVLISPYMKNQDIVMDPVTGAPTGILNARESWVAANGGGYVSPEQWWGQFPQIHQQFNNFPSLPGTDLFQGMRTMSGMEFISQRMVYATDWSRTIDQANYATNLYNQVGMSFDWMAMCPSFTLGNQAVGQAMPDGMDFLSLYMGSLSHNRRVVVSMGDGHAKSVSIQSITYNTDTDPASAGDVWTCLWVHNMRMCPSVERCGYSPNPPLTAHETELMQAWGKVWDPSW